MCLNLRKDSCSEAIMRLIIFLLNGVFFIAALLLIGFGFSVAVSQFGVIPAGVPWYYHPYPYITIIIGAFILTMATVGICGIIRKSKYITGVYVGGLLIILLANIISIPSVQSSIALAAEDSKKIWQNMYLGQLSKWDGENGQNAQIWDGLQNKFNCCGVKSYHDWKNSTFQSEAKKLNANATIPVPDSCCKTIDSSMPWEKIQPKCGLVWTDASELKLNGCLVEIENFMKEGIESMDALILEALGALCLVEIIAMAMSFYLIKKGFTYQPEYEKLK